MSSVVPRRERTAVARRFNPFEFFGEMFPTWAFEPMVEWEPWGMRMEEAESEVVVRAEVPGFEASEIEVTVSGNELTVRAEHTEPAEGERKERRRARFVETMTLPTGLELEKMEARYHNGVLEVHVPRTPEVKPRRIEVKT